MLPRWHILLGLVFAFLIWISAPYTPFIYVILVFLSSFLIDFDHYMSFVRKTGKLSLLESFDYYKKDGVRMHKERSEGLRRKGDFHLFHTLEFHILIAVLGLFWLPFFYIFLGMVFHSMLDIFYSLHKGFFYRREYFFFNWLAKKF